jgi:hypothetical protein
LNTIQCDIQGRTPGPVQYVSFNAIVFQSKSVIASI